jgi:hypothetical protein
MATGNKRQLTASEKRWRWAAGILGVMALSTGFGCDLASMSYFLWPGSDNIDAQCKLTPPKGKKETTVVLMASFASLETRPEFQTVDRELCERLAVELKKRADGNKEKVKIVPYYQVKSYLNKELDAHVVDKREVAKHFNADYVINLEINNMSLYEGSYRQLFRGTTEISVTAFKVDQPSGEGPILEEVYQTEYPTSGPIDAGGGNSVLQFRTLFLSRLAKDLSRYFEAYPHDEKYDFDQGHP